MSKKPSGASTIFVILGLLFIAVIGLRTISTPEIWSHLAQGKHNAPLSFLAADNAINTTWLYDKLAYSMWSAGGASLLIILNIAGMVGTFLLLIQIAKKWGGPLSQGFALLIAGHLMFQTVDVGPETIMMLCIALALYLMTTAKNPAILFGTLIPLQILWTNMHSSFLYGPIIAALFAIQASQSQKGPARKNNHAIQSGTYAMLAAGLLIATAINPSVFKLHGQVLASLTSPAPSYWSSLFIDYFQIPALKPLILFVMILGAGGLITLKKKLPVVLTTAAIFGAFLVWTSAQMSLLFSVLGFPFIVLSLTAISEYLSGSLGTVLDKQKNLLVPATQIIFVLLFVFSLVPVVSNCAYIQTGSASSFGLGVAEQLYPSDIEAIINDPAFPAPEKTINLAADGGYIAFNYDRKIFLDVRPGRYDSDLLKNVNKMMLGDAAAYDAIYDEFRPEAIIINTLGSSSAQGITTLLAKQIWKLAYFDGTTAILIKDKEQYADIINNTAAQTAGLAKLEAARAQYAATAGKGCKAGNPAELIGSGKIFLAFNRPVESKAIFSLLLQGNGNIPGAWIGLGNSQLLLKEFDPAMASLKHATEIVPDNFMAWASYATACKYGGNKSEFDRAIAAAKQLAERNKEKVEEKPPAETDEPVKEVGLEDLTVE